MGNWNWLIIIYLFLGGLGAGAYLTSFLAEKRCFIKATSLKRIGFYLAGPCTAVAIFLFALNLGASISGIIRMISNLRSIMSWGTYILIAFVIVGFICAFYTRQNLRIPVLWSYLGALLSLIIAMYTGVLLSTIFAVPFWNTVLIPILFVVSALSIGLASTSLLAGFTEKSPFLNSVSVNRIQSVLISVQLISIIIFLGSSAGRGVVADTSAQKILTGELAFAFWFLLIAVGLALPLIYYVLGSKEKAGTEEKPAKAMLSEIAVLIGGLTLRAVVVFAGLPIWDAIK